MNRRLGTEPFTGSLPIVWPRVKRLTASLVAGSAAEKRHVFKIVAYRLQLKLQGIDVQPAWGYSDSGGPYLNPILRTLEITSVDSVIDLGSGKGGVADSGAISFCESRWRRNLSRIGGDLANQFSAGGNHEVRNLLL